MTNAAIGYGITSIYYAISITYLYFKLLTPKAGIPCPRLICGLIILSNALWAAIDSEYIHFTLIITLVLPLFLFRDIWKRRFTSLTIVYILQISAEIMAISIAQIPIYLISGNVMQQHVTDASPLWEILCLISPIILIGTLLTIFLTPVFVTWMQYFKMLILAVLTLPLIFATFCQSVTLSIAQKQSELLPVLIVVNIILYALCYIPITWGFHSLHQQAMQREQQESQKLLIQQQLDGIRQLEAEYRSLRSWNHDIANHFISLSYLLDNEKYEEADSYITQLLSAESSKIKPNHSP